MMHIGAPTLVGFSLVGIVPQIPDPVSSSVQNVHTQDPAITEDGVIQDHE